MSANKPKQQESDPKPDQVEKETRTQKGDQNPTRRPDQRGEDMQNPSDYRDKGGEKKNR